MKIAGLYAIADAGVLRARGVGLRGFAEALRSAGVSVVQWRDKDGSPQEVLAGAAVLRQVFAGTDTLLLMNDRADLAILAGFGGVHVGQGDLTPEDAKAVGRALVVGLSTHTEAEVRAAEASAADYIAIGPVFPTGSKPDAAQVVGLAGVRMARALTSRPLVAIGGITRVNARSVVDAGADAVAVISGLLAEGEPAEKVARDFLAFFR